MLLLYVHQLRDEKEREIDEDPPEKLINAANGIRFLDNYRIIRLLRPMPGSDSLKVSQTQTAAMTLPSRTIDGTNNTFTMQATADGATATRTGGAVVAGGMGGQLYSLVGVLLFGVVFVASFCATGKCSSPPSSNVAPPPATVAAAAGATTNPTPPLSLLRSPTQQQPSLLPQTLLPTTADDATLEPTWSPTSPQTPALINSSLPRFCTNGFVSGNVCCAGSCGRCGSTGCGQLVGGAQRCCTGSIRDAGRSCQDPEDVVCLIRPPSSPSPTPAPIDPFLPVSFCTNGFVSGNVCCAGSCGRCGDKGCGQLMGGAHLCCTGSIRDAGRSCQDPEDVVCLIPAEEEQPTPAPPDAPIIEIASSFPVGSTDDGACIGKGDPRVPVGDSPSYTDLWKNVGYRGTGFLPGSSEVTSNRSCIITATQLEAAPYNVIPSDTGDDSAGIQAAIDFIRENCAGSYAELSLIELPAGTINLSTEIHVDVSYLIIRGQGSDPDAGTRIEFEPGSDTVYDGIVDFDLNGMKDVGTATGGWIWPGRGAFRVQTREVHESYDSDYVNAPANRKDFYEGSVNFHWKGGIRLKENALFGTTTLTLEEASGFSVGDFVWVGAANSNGMYNRQGVKEKDRILGHMRQQIFVVTSVSNDIITIDKPLEFDAFKDSVSDGSSPICGAESSADQTKVVPLKIVEGIGFEDFYLTQIVRGHDPSKAKWNYNNIEKEQAMHGIVFKWAANSYVKNMRSFMTGSHPIVTESAKNLQFQDNHLEGSWNKGKGGNGYFRNSRLWDSLIQDNTSIALRHLTLQWSASGNVVRRNTLDSDLNLHGGWERHNLMEQNVVSIPYSHRDCSPNCGADEDDVTWYPIWWGAGEHAGGWSGATGPRNIFFNNVFKKQLTPGGEYTDYAPYGTSSETVFQFGWDGDSLAGSQWKHLALNGTNMPTWTGAEQFSFTPTDGVNDNCFHLGESLLDATSEQCY